MQKEFQTWFDFGELPIVFGDRDQPHQVDHQQSLSPQLLIALPPETFPRLCQLAESLILLACGVLTLNHRWTVLRLLLVDVE